MSAPYFSDESVTLWHGDALAVLSEMPAESVDCCVTSPPYYGLRDYGVEGQLGLEATPAEYVENLRAVFGQVRRVLADDGTCWLNIGDSFSGYHGNKRVADDKAPSNKPGYWENMRGSLPGGIGPKNLLGIPWRVAFALQDDGSADVYELRADAPDSVAQAAYLETCRIRTPRNEGVTPANTRSDGGKPTPSDMQNAGPHGTPPTETRPAPTAAATTSSTASKRSSVQSEATPDAIAASGSEHYGTTAGTPPSAPVVVSGTSISSHSTTSAAAGESTGPSSERSTSTSGSTCAGRDTPKGSASSATTATKRSDTTALALTPKNEPARLRRADIPDADLAHFRLVKQDRWILRNDVIWHKPNAMPESVTDRLSTRHEHLFLFTRAARYWFDLGPIREPVAYPNDDRSSRGQSVGHIHMGPATRTNFHENGRNPGDVWTIPTQPFTGALRTSHQHLDPHGPDAAAYGKERIASANCPQHGSVDRPGSTASRGGREAAYEIRTSGTGDHRGPAPVDDSAPTETNPGPLTQPSNSGSPRQSHESAATPHSSGTHRTDPDPSTSQPCTTSARTPLHTEHIEGGLDFDVPVTSTGASSSGAHDPRAAGARTMPRTADRRTCSWVDNTASTSHFAVMAPELARRAILAGCKPGGTVLDPFSGAGTTGMVAGQTGRRYVGIDLSRDYLDLSLRTRLAQTAIVEDVS